MPSASLSTPASVSAAPLHPADLAVYIHWPFCRSKCPYCDFNSHVREGIDEERWLAAYRAQLARLAAETAGRTVRSVFFGGGTPSLMAPATAAAILGEIARRWCLAPDAEVTLEANPSTAEAGRFRDFAAAGIGRLSIGVQALDDAALRFLGRGHSAAEAVAAVAMASRVFCRYSFDLIWGRPGQRPAEWRRELGEAVAMAGDHLSVYQLTIEPGTAFRRDGVAAAGEETALAMWRATEDLLAAAGLPAYEISNHARRGGECRHNLAVWQGGDYLGVGPGAHGRITGGGGTVATRAGRSPEKWLAAIEAGGDGLAERECLSAAERREELLLMGLRLTRGIDRARFHAAAGGQPEAAVDQAALTALTEGGFLEADAEGLWATAAGRLRLNAVLARLLA